MGKTISDNSVGEIAVKIPYLALGYWGKPDLTKEKFCQTKETDGARIYLTGDLDCLSNSRIDGEFV